MLKPSTTEERTEHDDFDESATLIPEHIVDQASQRIFVISIFVLIQCWKIYDILLIRADLLSLEAAAESGGTIGAAFSGLNNFTFLMKYAVIDGIFLWLLPIFNIPLLSFSPVVTLLLNGLTLAFTVMLASDSAIPLLSSVFVPIWNFIFKQKELTIVGDSVSPLAVSDMNAHFKGRYTIKYLPESSVHLNPFHLKDVCLESTKSDFSPFPSSIRLPIEFNTTTEIGYMQIEHISPSNAVSYLNYSSYDVKRLRARDVTHLSQYPGFVSNDDRVFYLELPIKKPGKYKISRVTDKEGSIIRSYKSEFAVAHCPSVQFVYPGPELSYSGYKCVGEKISDLSWSLPLVELYGALPLTVEFAAFSGSRKLVQLTAQVDQVPGSPKGNIDSQRITRNSLEQELLKKPGIFNTGVKDDIRFQVLSVQDNLGIQRNYNPASSDRDIRHVLHLKRSPKIRLIDDQPNHPLLSGSSKRLKVEIDEGVTFPLTVALYHQPLDEESQPSNETITISTPEELRKGIEVRKEGTYLLVAGNDKHCPCIADKRSITLKTPPKPEATISGVPITDKCLGDIGYEFTVDFNGSAPFVLSYDVFKNSSGILRPVLSNSATRRHVTTSSSKKHQFQYKTTEEGSYLIVFRDVKDANYKKQSTALDSKRNTFLTYFRQRSFSSLANDGRRFIKLCKGGQATIPMSLNGNSPFSFRYEITDRSSGKVVSSEKVKDFSEDTFLIKTPKFTEGGEFDVTVKDITDKLGCPVESVGAPKVQISAKKSVPKITIKKSEMFKVVEGETVVLPIAGGLSSGDKVELTRQDLLDKSKVDTFFVEGQNKVRVMKQGIYKLKSFSLDGCPGEVSNMEHSVTVVHHPKPKLTVRGLTKDLSSLVCVNGPKKATLYLEGARPFIIDYTIKYPSGETRSSNIFVQDEKTEVTLPTDKEGHYEHRFTAVYDALYTREVLRRLQYKQEDSVIEYTVMEQPGMTIARQDQLLQVCESNLQRLNRYKIPVSYKGTAPFLVRGTIKHGEGKTSHKFHVEGLQSPEIDLTELQIENSSPEKVFTRGDHLIVFEDIEDGNGCTTQELGMHNSATVSVTKVPEIQKHSQKSYYCVGDHISYDLKGISPFLVYYKFNDNSRKADVGHEFRRLAAKPGQLSIEALQDSSASKCMVNYTFAPQKYDDLKLQIYDIPSVEISHGDAIIKSLHEGDQAEIVFKFTGVPPFEVTYVRTLAVNDNKKSKKKTDGRGRRKLVDQKTIKDIWDYEHIEVVNLEGTYDAIFIKDAYCQASRDVLELL